MKSPNCRLSAASTWNPAVTATARRPSSPSRRPQGGGSRRRDGRRRRRRWSDGRRRSRRRPTGGRSRRRRWSRARSSTCRTSATSVTSSSASSSDRLHLVLLQRRGGHAHGGEAEHGDTADGAGGEQLALLRVVDVADPVPPLAELAATDRHLHVAIGQLGDDARQHHRHDELGNGQAGAGVAADDLEDRPVVEVQPVRPRADPVERLERRGTSPSWRRGG